MLNNIGNIFTLVLSVLICELAGLVGLIFSLYSKSCWYIHLKKPPYNPPYHVYGYAWTILYILLGISLYLIWSHGIDIPAVAFALKLFAFQLILNAVWSITFYGFRYIFGGFVVAVALLFTVALTVIKTFPISPAASILMLSYLMWATFVTYFNYEIWKLNKLPARSFNY